MGRPDTARAVVLGTQLDGDVGDLLVGWLGELDKRARKAVERAGLVVVSENTKDCFDSTCLGPVAQRNRARVVVVPRMLVDTKVPPGYHISILVFDATTGTVTREQKADCAACFESKAADLFYATTSDALAPEPVGAKPETRRTHRKAYLALGSLSAGLLVAGVVALIVEGASVNGSCANEVPTGIRCPVTVNATNGMAGSGVAALLGAVGTATFFLLAHREHKREHQAWIAPALDLHGGGVAVGGKF